MMNFIKNFFVHEEEEENLMSKLPDIVVLLNNQGSFLWYNDLAQKTLSELKENFADGYIDDILEGATDLIVKKREWRTRLRKGCSNDPSL